MDPLFLLHDAGMCLGIGAFFLIPESLVVKKKKKNKKKKDISLAHMLKEKGETLVFCGLGTQVERGDLGAGRWFTS